MLTPMTKSSSAQVLKYTNAQMLSCSVAEMRKCTNAQMLSCSVAEMRKCTNAQILSCSNAQMHKCTNSSNAQIRAPNSATYDCKVKSLNKVQHHHQKNTKTNSTSENFPQFLWCLHLARRTDEKTGCATSCCISSQ